MIAFLYQRSLITRAVSRWVERYTNRSRARRFLSDERGEDRVPRVALRELRGAERLAEIEALGLRTGQLSQTRQLLAGFHPFGHNLDSQIFSHADHGADDAVCIRIRRQ